jgi:hypothetical protein
MYCNVSIIQPVATHGHDSSDSKSSNEVVVDGTPEVGFEVVAEVGFRARSLCWAAKRHCRELKLIMCNNAHRKYTEAPDNCLEPLEKKLKPLLELWQATTNSVLGNMAFGSIIPRPT